MIDSVEGASGAVQIGSFYKTLPELASPNLLSASPFSTSKLSDHPKASCRQPEAGILSSHVAAPKSPSSSCSHSSSSSHSCSSGQNPSVVSVIAGQDPMLGDNSGNGALKRVRSDAELHASSREERKLMQRSQSHKTLTGQPNIGNLPPLPKNSSRFSHEVGTQRVKVSYGNERVRFRMPNNWGFKDLLQEIARRFNIDDITRCDLKYLDDDSDWVLLTCDDDLEECIDVCQLSNSNTIKFLLQVSPHFLGRSFCSSPL